MIDTAIVLPHVTATLNAVTMLFLVAGYVMVRRGNHPAHRAAMLAAVTSSGLFLVFYLIYHFTAPIFVFRGQGAARPFYYTVLISHVVLAAAVTPLVLLTLVRGLRGHAPAHCRLARWTLPVWLYVSVTGMVVYVMLYRIDWA